MDLQVKLFVLPESQNPVSVKTSWRVRNVKQIIKFAVQKKINNIVFLKVNPAVVLDLYPPSLNPLLHLMSQHLDKQSKSIEQIH